MVKILVVDDSKTMRMLITRVLRSADLSELKVVEAENGKDGLEKVSSESPDLILSDWNMPEMDGGEFLVELRKSGNDTPFGFITTEGGSDMKEQMIGKGAQFVLEKPFTEVQVETTISQFVS